MEYAQLESRIQFLDSEYRREKADVAQLRQQLALSENERQELVKRIESLEAEILSHKSETQRINILETRLERTKSEMMTALTDQKERQRQALKDAEKSRQVELAPHTRAISEIRREVERSQDLDELITLARTETERLAANQVSFQHRLDQVAKNVDEQLRSITYLEEQRRVDTKKTSELQNESTNLFKRVNLQLAKVELLEQQIPQFGQFQIALEQNREKIRAEVERSQHQISAVERQLKSWDQLSESIQRRLDEYEQRIERYAEQYQINRRSLEGLEAFREQLVREQREFIELQRLAFDRQQSKLQEQETVQEKQIRDQGIEVEKQVNELNKAVKTLQVNLETLSQQLEKQKPLLTLLLRIAEEDAITRANSARDWHGRFEQLATEGE